MERLLAVVVVLAGAAALAHSGGLDANGCHHDRKRGGYHCHRGNYVPPRREAPRQEPPVVQARPDAGPGPTVNVLASTKPPPPARRQARWGRGILCVHEPGRHCQHARHRRPALTPSAPQQVTGCLLEQRWRHLAAEPGTEPPLQALPVGPTPPVDARLPEKGDSPFGDGAGAFAGPPPNEFTEESTDQLLDDEVDGDDKDGIRALKVHAEKKWRRWSAPKLRTLFGSAENPRGQAE